MQPETAALEQFVQELATQFVLGGDRGDDPASTAQMLATLGRISEAARASGSTAVVDASGELTRKLQPANGGGPERKEVQSGIEALQKAISSLAASASAPAATPSSFGSLAQDLDLVSDFMVEAREHLSNVETQLLALEQEPAAPGPLQSLFRSFHTIKGLAGFLEFHDVQSVCHDVETLLDRARNNELAITPEITDLLLESADYLTREIGRIEHCILGNGTTAADNPAPLLDKVRAVLEGGEVEAAPEPEAIAEATTPEVRPEPVQDAAPEAAPEAAKRPVSTPTVPAATEQKKPAVETAGVKQVRPDRLVKVDTGKLDYLVDMVGELVVAQSLIRHDPAFKSTTDMRLQRNLLQLGRITDEVQRASMAMRMVPIGQLFQKMDRLIRDLSRKWGKKIELETTGRDIEMDRNMVEELGDPLMHMVRNAVDHGIETAEERKATGKPAVAKVRLKAQHQAGQILITVSDDGRGINRQRIFEKAVRMGLADPNSSLSDNEVFHLIFEPGFSTAEKVTDLSGRGVGMDVVKKQIHKLRGRIEIASRPGDGTDFLLKLPLTLAIIDGLIVKVGAERFIVPLASVREVLQPREGMLTTMENRAEVAVVRDHLFPIVRLHQRFNIEPRSRNLMEGLLMLLETHGRTYSLAVDELIGKQEVVIKNLGETFRDVPGVAGGAILGDGRVGLILDVDALYKGTRNA
ncbi:MAG TPA: chemotaxis protein CheA [Bryobacteraceae bacterium]|nr:chemotaxis protein CheA [Bryobacteraceae bacterium]